MKVRWSHDPEPHDYPAAISFLSLITDPAQARSLAEGLAEQPIVFHKAKDVLRAARLPLLPLDDPYVAKDLKRVRKGKALSPVLLIRGALGGTPLLIADGYHRVCASYHVSEDTDVSAQIVTAERN
ncbi:hypothetical protein [Leifsonia poae]|uniref:hypothetical protein n=1 Tax=Leifsonia poae TaxID=110933 RepID=UPI001CC149D0|nr:hypothetical protein [Leifsonia poae]